MSNGAQRNVWLSQTSVRVGFVLAAIIQTVALTSWLVRMYSDIEFMKSQQASQDRIISKLDETGSRQLAPLSGRLEEMSAALMRYDMQGSRKEIEIEQQLKSLAGQQQSLRELYDQRSKIIERANEAFAQMAATQVRLKHIEEEHQRLAREIEKLDTALDALNKNIQDRRK